MADNFSNQLYDLASNQKQQLHAKTAQWIPNGMEPKKLMSRYIIISSCCVVQSLKCFWLFATPWIVERPASWSFINSQSLLTVMSILSIMPSYHLIADVPSLSVLNLFQYQVLFQWVSSSHQVAKVLEFQLQHQSFQWTLRTDLL